jgi:hypothetical protein
MQLREPTTTGGASACARWGVAALAASTLQQRPHSKHSLTPLRRKNIEAFGSVGISHGGDTTFGFHARGGGAAGGRGGRGGGGGGGRGGGGGGGGGGGRNGGGGGGREPRAA